jgi:ubiquinone/menaquinone biosynthesis C-methylase UbiE
MDINALPAFKALADQTRIRILNLLLERELNVNEIVCILKIGQSGISRHLKILADSGLARSRKDGLWSFFSAAADGEHADLLRYLRSVFAREPQLQADERSAVQVIVKREKESQHLFDSLAPRWEEMKKEVLGDFDLNAEIASRITGAVTAADLGCGTGDLLEALCARAKKVIGVDSSPEMIRAARERFTGRNGAVEVRMGEFEHLPLADGEAEAAICSMVLHHLPDPARGIREAARVLARGGRFVLADFAAHDDEIMRRKFGDRRLGFSRKTAETWLGKAGFGNINVKKYPVKRNLTVLVWSADKK